MEIPRQALLTGFWVKHEPESQGKQRWRELQSLAKSIWVCLLGKEWYLLQIGVSIRVSVGKDPPVLPATWIFQLQNLLTVLMIQRALTGCFILVQIYFKLRSQRNKSSTESILILSLQLFGQISFVRMFYLHWWRTEKPTKVRVQGTRPIV